MAGVGESRGADPREMAKSDLIVVWGGNPVSTQVNVMTHISRARKERGAKLVVIDPYRTPTAAVADMHLAPRPGTDAALACAVMHVAFRDGHADRDYMRDYTDCPDRAGGAPARPRPGLGGRDHRPPGRGRSRRSPRSMAHTQRSYIRCGYGFARSRNGAAAMHAVTCLPAVTGAWQHEGGGALWSNRGMYRLEQDADRRPRRAGLHHPHARHEPHRQRADRRSLANSATGRRCTAMLIQNQNPVTVCPDSNRVRRGFARDDLFVATHEQFMTETARWSDIVLPATMFMEHDDLYQAGGHSHIQIGPKLIEPPGECRSNHEVIQGLASRLGAKHRGFDMTAMEIIDATLRASGWPDAKTVLARALDRRHAAVRGQRISSTASHSRTGGSISRPTGRRSATTTR